MRVRVTVSIEVKADKWAVDNDCTLSEVRSQVCASVVNCVQVELEDYASEVVEARG